MAGIYIHVPFCKSRCIYCGFFSTVSLGERDKYVDKVIAELASRKDYLRGEDVETIYFGGGTPSLLTAESVEKVLKSIYNIYNVRANAEITLEGNPDDMNPAFLSKIRSLGVNRLSMGVQTFDDKRLAFLHRRHSAEQAVSAVADARKAGFSNISVDLMFGFPGQSLEEWKQDVEAAINLNVEHISAYSLMYEDGTVLTAKLEKGEIEEIDEELSLQMYQYLVGRLKSAGYEHYEISNFGKSGFQSRHNSSYWNGTPYLGVGAGAHSFDGNYRQYNVESLTDYMHGVEQVTEKLTCDEKYNEYIFTGLRTSEGLKLDDLFTRFGDKYYNYCLQNASKHIASGKLLRALYGERGKLLLSSSGIFVSNDILSDLMFVE